MEQEMKSSYIRFGAMIVTSMVVMYGVMYLNTYEIAHVRWSETRFFMTFLMGASMAVIMLSFMQGMYSNKRVNLAINLGNIAVCLSDRAVSGAQPDYCAGCVVYARHDSASFHRDSDQ